MAEIADEPSQVVLSARNRHQGDPDTPETRRDKRHPAYSEPAGQAIFAHCPHRAADLWTLYAGLTNAETIYRKYYIGRTAHPSVARLDMLPETLETRADMRPDLRTEDERAVDAVRRWMAWQGRVGRLDIQSQAAIWAVVRHGVVPFADTRPTPAGQKFVDALLEMQKV